MALIVQKYGGTSVGSVERIKNVARRVMKAREKGDQVVVVVSAMSGETDKLVRMAREIAGRPDERELDMLLSTGERVTIALLAMRLIDEGCPAESLTGRQVGIVTDSAHTKARIERIEADRVRQALAEGKVPIVAGFQGIDEKSDVTTLGRGGSDTTAVALAAALGADLCDIYTDVDGVYTTDPNVAPNARRLDRISYDEMLGDGESRREGPPDAVGRVRQEVQCPSPGSVELRRGRGRGTLVTREDEAMERVVVSGVTYNKNEAKITIVGVPDRPGSRRGSSGRSPKPISTWT